MTTQELKSYIDRILGNNIRLLLPSYWWKRAFGAVIDKVDEKVEKSELKTINGESVLGEGDLKIGVKSVESVEALEKLDAEVGDIASVGVDSEQAIKVSDCLLLPFTPGVVDDWDKLSVVTRIEEKTASLIDTVLYLRKSKESLEKGTIIVGCEEGKPLYIKAENGHDFVTTLQEINDILSHGDYRIAYCLETSQIDSSFNFYRSTTKSDAYIKSDSWEKLAKEYIVASESELNALDAPMGTVAKVAGIEFKQVKVSECYQSSNFEEDWDKYTILKKVSVKSEPTVAAQIILVKSLDDILAVTNLLVIGGSSDVGVKAWHKKVELTLEQANELLLQNEYRLLYPLGGDIDSFLNFYKKGDTISDAYIKGETWTRLLKEGDATGGGGGIEIREFYIGDSLPQEQRDWNLETKRLVEENKCTTVYKLTETLGIMPVGTVIPQSLYKEGLFFYMMTSAGSTAIVEVGVDKYGNCPIATHIATADSNFSTTSTNAIQNKVVTAALNAKADKTYVDEKVANATGGGSTPFRIWYSYDLTPAQKEDNVRAYNALMNKETFDFELLYIDEGEDYYSIEKSIVTGFTCHMDSQKVHINILVAATEDGLMNDTLYLASDGTFAVEEAPF